MTNAIEHSRVDIANEFVAYSLVKSAFKLCEFDSDRSLTIFRQCQEGCPHEFRLVSTPNHKLPKVRMQAFRTILVILHTVVLLENVE